MSTQLPFDIQRLIIQSLPIKSLLRFRSLCKPWNSFISSSRFIAFHHAHSHQQQHHLFISYENLDDDELKCVSVFDHDHQTFALTLVPPPLVQGTRLLDSSHGLFCMLDSFDRFSKTIMPVLWNPAIRRSIAVAVPNVVDQQFDSVVGFGVCPATMDPKLLKITFITDPLEIQSISCIPFQVMVFTLSSGQWTTPSTNLPSKSFQFQSRQTVVGHFIYWVGTDWSARNDDDDEGRTLIMSFDLTTHEFREVDIPNSLRRSYDMSLSRLRESLVLLHTDQDLIQDKQVFHVWMMMDDGDSKAFTKLFTINPPNAYVWQTLGFRESGEPIIEWAHDKMDGTSALGVYEPGLGDIKDLGIRGNKDSFFGTCYTESLLLLGHEDGRIIRCLS